MQLPPISVILTWPEPNYEHPSEVRGPAILVLTCVFVPVLVTLVALRAYTRLRLTRNFGADDVAIVAAVVPTLACAAATTYAVGHLGWDRHVWDVPAEGLVLSLKLAVAVEVLFSLACTLTRISILALVLRLMATGRGFLRRLAICSMVFICVEEVVFAVVVINTCSPVSEYWTLSFEPQQCINEPIHILVAGIINTFNDFCVVMIPIPVVLKLRLPLRQRIFCAMLFSTGFIVCIAGAVRIYFFYQLNTTYDKTWLSYPTWICGTLELYLGIMATTIPAIKPLVARYFPNILGLNFTRHGGQATVDGQVKSLDRYPDRTGGARAGTSGMGPDSSTTDFVRIPSPEIGEDCEKGLISAVATPVSSKTRPLILSPVVSTFSTYRKGEENDNRSGGAVASSVLSVGEGQSSKTSISSFDATWTPK